MKQYIVFRLNIPIQLCKLGHNSRNSLESLAKLASFLPSIIDLSRSAAMFASFYLFNIEHNEFKLYFKCSMSDTEEGLRSNHHLNGKNTPFLRS
jgi:hypothetical protein